MQRRRPPSSSPSYFHHHRQDDTAGRDIEFGGDNHAKGKHLKKQHHQHDNSTSLSNYNTKKKSVVNCYAAIIFLLLLVIGLLYLRPQGNDDRQQQQQQQQQQQPSRRIGGIGSSSTRQRLVTTKLPKDWQAWTFGRFKDEFQCRVYLDRTTKPLYTLEYWQIMRNTYIQQVDNTYIFDDPVPPTKGYSLHVKGNTQPYYAAQSPGRGRGVFASRNIHKDELVHDGTKSDITFPDATSWRRFMFALPKKEIACDVTEWTWTQRLQEKYSPMKIMTSFTISVLMNEGDTEEEVNALPESSISSSFYATREIHKGEEILTSYEMYDTDYDAVGLGW